MSIQAVAWVLRNERATRGAERLVLLVLADYADEEGCSYPSVGRIQREANIGSETTVHTCITRLVERGLLERVLQAAPDLRIRADRRPNLYRLPFADLVGNPVDTSDGVPKTAPRPPVDNPPRGTNLRGDGVPNVGTQTTNEPSLPPPSTLSVLEALVEVAAWEEGERLTRSQRANLVRAATELVEVDATPEDIRARAVEFGRRWPNATLTPRALATHWASLFRGRGPEPVERCVECSLAMPRTPDCWIDPQPAGCPARALEPEPVVLSGGDGDRDP